MVAVLVFAVARVIDNNYVFFAGYVVLQFVVLATAWNILGGYCGYVNFGSAAGVVWAMINHRRSLRPLSPLAGRGRGPSRVARWEGEGFVQRAAAALR